MVIWVTGKANAGKTTLAKKLNNIIPNSIILDGDDIRNIIKSGFDDKSRFEHIIRIAKMAAVFENQKLIPIIALVSPIKMWRDEARKLFKESLLYYIPGGDLWAGTKFEIPDEEELKPRLIIKDNKKKKGTYDWKEN